jgi:hypothetical protein
VLPCLSQQTAFFSDVLLEEELEDIDDFDDDDEVDEVGGGHFSVAAQTSGSA